MNLGKKGPYILILLLVIILIFILGVQYGKRVKIADTAISILLSISPSPKPSPLPLTKYSSYTHKDCKLSFLYPSYLKLESESSQEAKFNSADKKQFVLLNCPKKISQPTTSTDSASITIDGVRAQHMEKVNNKGISTTSININSVPPIELIMNKELEPLIITSIELK